MTEIGISSQVFQQLSGLANFPSMPSPRELFEVDEDNVSITSGTISGYITRASFFTVYIRPAGVDEDGNEFSFEPTKLLLQLQALIRLVNIIKSASSTPIQLTTLRVMNMSISLYPGLLRT